MDNLELRMYGLVNYQLTGIQKGIQFAHAAIEYGIDIENSNNSEQRDIYSKWRNEDKTVILLNGGTTNDRIMGDTYFGTLNNHKVSLDKLGVFNSTFREPDLGDQLTAVVFILDERVFNREKYPDYENFLDKYPDSSPDLWLKVMGGQKIVDIRKFISQFKLA
jgi:hypothetical protein